MTIKFAPTYSLTTGQPILRSTDIGSHQINELGDGTISLEANTVDMWEHDFEAVEHVRLDELEQYKLYLTLREKFIAQTDGRE